MRLAHISDLHVGKVKLQQLIEVKKSLEQENIDHILITGDVTDNGTTREYNQFLALFKNLIDSDRLIIAPGNHDRLGDCVAKNMMDRRVETTVRNDLYIVKVDSTGPHNWLAFAAHGLICDNVLKDIDAAISQAKPEQLVVVMLHHHPMPLPTESLLEFMSTWLSWPFAKELHLGQKLIELVSGRVDLLLHGHKHTPSEFIVPNSRPLQICNAGCTPALGRYRIFKHEFGEVLSSKWHHI